MKAMIGQKRPKISKLARQEERQGYLFILPWLIGLFGITLFPMLFSLYASFTNYDVTSRMDFIGLDNYRRMFTDDPLFWRSLSNTLYYVVWMVPLTTIGSILLALLLNEKVVGMRFFRTIYYLPAVLSGVGVYFLWMQLLSPTSGLINTLLSWIGISGPAWLSDPMWTKPAIIMMKMWAVGGGMLLYLASLQGVPAQLYEAAKLDGASVFRRFWHITLPMISPVIFFDVITSFIGGFQVFQEGYVMTENGSGGPMNSLLFYNLHMWHKAFTVFDMGYAMGMAWVLFAIVLVLTLINMKLSKRWVYYEGEDQ
ncbi:multiple sugar transport system permease protein [Paenibacillus sp. SORGH_AS306]|uniref:carbohydrate ABC transporter permease n=1 Tax=unclassified Paenibacillus TaxID=185978 RepID=UPI002365AAFE|nr:MULTISPECIES: sugar ABC transporter permease [unclassified Paenibacillus]MDQ1236061.1 multiple sugar transport system permease protein [Paenibacillus sp. SORGH_AS_0306]MDR6108417.1 multiple sugar transport system permease protein [Paenibacillus sp. SORGH_AS_0338]WDF51306.1 sugar ABC transporter permease [Paenibacillus sp. KACC 21273]